MTKQSTRETPLLRKGAHLESSRVFNLTSDVRGHSREELPHARGQELQPR